MLRELTLGDLQIRDDPGMGFSVMSPCSEEPVVWVNERGTEELYDWLSEKLALEVIASRVAHSILAKARPNDMFAGEFFDLREKLKRLKNEESEKLRAKMERALLADLRGKKLAVEGKVSLGQYRGSKFVTSAKLKVGKLTQAQADKLLTYLRGKYSPKYKLKSFKEGEGIAFYNIR